MRNIFLTSVFHHRSASISKTKSNGGVNLIYLFGVDGMQRVYPELNNYFLMVLLVEVIIIVTRLKSKVFSL